MVNNMKNLFLNLNPIYQSLIAGLFTFSITMIGSSLVFLFKRINKFIMNLMLSLSAGIMISSSLFSLLIPAIDISDELNMATWLIIFIGFMCGGVILFIGDKLLNYLESCGKKSISKLKRSIMLFSSITLHNIPEGLVIGVAYGSCIYGSNLMGALILTIGIGLQNFPEGSAISLPLRSDGLSRFKAFLAGSLSAIVEPLFAVIGTLLVLKIKTILPFILSFTAGAMIFVSISELLPDVLKDKRKDLMVLFVMIGFSIMMILELVLS